MARGRGAPDEGEPADVLRLGELEPLDQRHELGRVAGARELALPGGLEERRVGEGERRPGGRVLGRGGLGGERGRRPVGRGRRIVADVQAARPGRARLRIEAQQGHGASRDARRGDQPGVELLADGRRSVDDVQSAPPTGERPVETEGELERSGERALLDEGLAVGETQESGVELVGSRILGGVVASEEQHLDRSPGEQQLGERGELAGERFARGEQDEHRWDQQELLGREAAPVETLEPGTVPLGVERLRGLEAHDAHRARQIDDFVRRLVEGAHRGGAALRRDPRGRAEIGGRLPRRHDPEWLVAAREVTRQAVAGVLETLPAVVRNGRSGAPVRDHARQRRRIDETLADPAERAARRRGRRIRPTRAIGDQQSLGRERELARLGGERGTGEVEPPAGCETRQPERSAPRAGHERSSGGRREGARGCPGALVGGERADPALPGRARFDPQRPRALDRSAAQRLQRRRESSGRRRIRRRRRIAEMKAPELLHVVLLQIAKRSSSRSSAAAFCSRLIPMPSTLCWS